MAEASAAALGRLGRAEEDERAAAKAQHMAELADSFEVMQMEHAAGESSRAAGSSSEAGPSTGARAEVEVPNDYICPITSEIMNDPVVTVWAATFLQPSPLTPPASLHL